MKAISIVGAVGDDFAGGEAGNQAAGWRHVVLLAGANGEADGQAECVYDGMKLSAEATTGTAESLSFRSPLLRRAPAAWA